MTMNMSVLCKIACSEGESAQYGEGDEEEPREDEPPRPPNRPRQGLVTYAADAHLQLMEPPIRAGEVWHLCPEDGHSFRQGILSLHPNGLSVTPIGEGPRAAPLLSIAWSPFSLVQACRLHTVQADESQPHMRLFKVSIFHHGLTHFFATQGEKADMERARWVADVSRALRMLTQSLFPRFSLRADPLPGASWTATRLLAGYLLLYDDLGVSLVYGELHTHWDAAAAFAAYEDEYCDVQVVHLCIDMHTCVSERVGIDCSCFSLGDHHFSTRSCSEKMLWLRAISNVKVKLRHWASNPTPLDLRHYRSSIAEHLRGLPQPPEEAHATGPLLPRRNGFPMSSLAASLPLMGGRAAAPSPSGATVPLGGPDEGSASPSSNGPGGGGIRGPGGPGGGGPSATAAPSSPIGAEGFPVAAPPALAALAPSAPVAPADAPPPPPPLPSSAPSAGSPNDALVPGNGAASPGFKDQKSSPSPRRPQLVAEPNDGSPEVTAASKDPSAAPAAAWMPASLELAATPPRPLRDTEKLAEDSDSRQNEVPILPVAQQAILMVPGSPGLLSKETDGQLE
mmetsp:Transcript_77283/g.202783  ORF Transcript_77283/g.202783 Transcript_77283/m.202783 type:complete len:566 (+) Transcript_77283:201-1898(+)